MRKFVKIGFASLAMIAGFAPQAVVAQETTTLNVWSDATRLSMFEKFDELHDNVDLKITTVSTEDFMPKLLLAFRSKSNLPDAFFSANMNTTAQLVSRRSNFMLDLTDMIPQDVLDQYLDNANSVCYVDDKLYCLRNDNAHMHVWYHEPLMKELGEKVPETWEEYEALGERLASKGMVIGSAVDPVMLVNILTSSGCTLAAPVEGQKDTLKVDATSKQCERAATMIDNMTANGSLSKLAPYDPGFVRLFKDKKVPLLVGPTWYGEHVIKKRFEAEAGTIAAALPMRWADQEQPLTWSYGGGVYGGWNETEYPEQVADLIEWMSTSSDVQTDATTLPSYGPAAELWGEKLSSSEIYANDKVFETELAAAKFSNPNYVTLRIDIANAVLKALIGSVNSGETVVSGLPALQEELTNQAELNGYTVEAAE